MRTFESRGFSAAYTCEVDPEFPESGEWSCPVIAYSRDGTQVEDFQSRWGTPLIVRVQPAGASEWVGFFEAGGLGGINAVLATPDPNALCVVAEGRAYVIDVRDPSTCWFPGLDPVIQVGEAPAARTLVLAGFTELAGVGDSGLRWQSERLCLDGLQIREVSAIEIHCQGDYLEGPESFVVDARTGQLISGRNFIDPFG